ncbi:MAG: TetR/AcrR family transcriptional regulator [Hyphomicrobiaceae bacterium]
MPKSQIKVAPRAPSRRPGGEASETAQRILTAALGVFADQGFDGTTTRVVAERAGANLGLIKYYFGSKEELWRAAVDQVFAELLETLGEQAPLAITGRDDFARLVHAMVAFVAKHPNFIRIMNDEGKRDGPRADWLVENHGRRMFEISSEYLEQARALGLVPDVDVVHLYYMFLGSIVMLFSQAPEAKRLTGTDPTASPAIIAAHADALLALFLGEGRVVQK